jgi:hypothetical protein
MPANSWSATPRLIVLLYLVPGALLLYALLNLWLYSTQFQWFALLVGVNLLCLLILLTPLVSRTINRLVQRQAWIPAVLVLLLSIFNAIFYFAVFALLDD